MNEVVGVFQPIFIDASSRVNIYKKVKTGIKLLVHKISGITETFKMLSIKAEG
jgi:hypothetical protein